LMKDDVMNIQFTSGTTGFPKGVSLTHSNLLNNAIYIGQCMRLTSEDVLCNVPPLFHCFGLVLGNLAVWAYAGSIIYVKEGFDPVATVDALHEEQCTAIHGVPTHFLGILSELAKRRGAGKEVNISKLRTGIAAGSPVPISLMNRLIKEMNLRDLTIAYGMTETSPVSFQSTTDDSIFHRTETVGKVQPFVKAKIIDPTSKSTEPIPLGVPGELCVAGYLLQDGYWNDVKQTRQVMKTHPDDPHTLWMHTGDTGILDEDGYLRIVGRSKDIIIRGGENLFPVQIENRLTAHPLIREAAAISVQDDTYGEVVGVWIVREPPTESHGQDSILAGEVRKWVSEGMNPQNAPAWVWFLGEDGVQDELPKTASGKVQKHILREWCRDLVQNGVGKV